MKFDQEDFKNILIGLLVATIVALVSIILSNKTNIDQLKTAQEKFDASLLASSKIPYPTLQPPTVFKDVPKLEHPKFRGFRVLRDHRVIDLRPRIKNEGDKKTGSPVIWKGFLLLEKVVEGRSKIRLEYGTTGTRIDARSLTHKYRVLRSTTPHFHGVRKIKNTIQVETDIEDEDIGKAFIIITETTYWDGFQGEKEEWAGMSAKKDALTDWLGMTLIFPQSKPLVEYKIFESIHGAKEKVAYKPEPKNIHISSDRTVFTLQIEKPIPGHSYDVNWKW